MKFTTAWGKERVGRVWDGVQIILKLYREMDTDEMCGTRMNYS